MDSIRIDVYNPDKGKIATARRVIFLTTPGNKKLSGPEHFKVRNLVAGHSGRP